MSSPKKKANPIFKAKFISTFAPNPSWDARSSNEWAVKTRDLNKANARKIWMEFDGNGNLLLLERDNKNLFATLPLADIHENTQTGKQKDFHITVRTEDGLLCYLLSVKEKASAIAKCFKTLTGTSVSASSTPTSPTPSSLASPDDSRRASESSAPTPAVAAGRRQSRDALPPTPTAAKSSTPSSPTTAEAPTSPAPAVSRGRSMREPAPLPAPSVATPSVATPSSAPAGRTSSRGSLAAAEPATPSGRSSSTGRSTRSGSNGNVQSPPPKKDKDFQDAYGDIIAESELQGLVPAKKSLDDHYAPWSQSFTGLYMGCVPVSRPEGEDVCRAAVQRNEDVKKQLASLRKAKGGNMRMGDPCVLTISSDDVKVVDQSTGDSIFTTFIKQVQSSMLVEERNDADITTFIASDVRLGRMNCYIFHLTPGEGNRFSELVTQSRTEQRTEEAEQVGTNPFAVTDPTREKAPDTLFQKQIHRADLTAIECVGSGQFGSVYIASQIVKEGRGDGGSNKRTRAVKLLRNAAAAEHKEAFIHEAQIMLPLSHPNIMRMIGVAIQQKPWLCVLEYMQYGDLRGVLLACEEKGISLEYAEQVCWGMQLASGCEYLASQRLVHMDLAARNAMLSESNIVKVGDFGLTHPFDNGKNHYTLDVQLKLPIRWVAPEGFYKKTFSEASDVWSFAVMFWELFTYGDTPYYETDTADVLPEIRKGMRLSQPPNCTDHMYDMMLQCWEKEPKKRPTFSQLVEILTDENNKQTHTVRDIGFILKSAKRRTASTASSLVTAGRLAAEKVRQQQTIQEEKESSSSSSESSDED